MLVYLIMAALLVLSGYVHIQTIVKPFYLVGTEEIDISKIILHGIINFLIFVPIMIRVLYLSFLWIQTKIIKGNIEK